MPIQIPAFVQYQAQLVPLRGLWNSPPTEGDRFISAELDWLNSPPGNAVQFQLSGNSPVALSQIVALAVDNAACGADIQFLFPDSASVLNVPARSSGVFPVFTNALMFYASAPNSLVGDRTVFQAFNSMPPPVMLTTSQAQNQAGVSSIPLQTNSVTQVIPAGINGTLNSVTINAMTVAQGDAGLTLYDGTNKTLWQSLLSSPANGETVTFPVTGLSARFTNGLNFSVSSTSFPSGWVTVNCYYSVP